MIILYLLRAYGERTALIGSQVGSDQHMPARICIFSKAEEVSSARGFISKKDLKEWDALESVMLTVDVNL